MRAAKKRPRRKQKEAAKNGRDGDTRKGRLRTAGTEIKRGGQTWPPQRHGGKRTPHGQGIGKGGSVLEGGATDELAHNGGRWDFLIADCDEVVDELQETVGFAVF